jgi:hypothetical protein
MGVRCVLHVASGLVGFRPKPTPRANNPSQKHNQPYVFHTQTIRNACQFNVVCGVCSVLRVSSGLLGCHAKINQQTTQPMQQHNQHHATPTPYTTPVDALMYVVCVV